jgi:MFS family permease
MTSLTLGISRFLPMVCMPVLFKEISQDTGMSLVQIGMVWGILPLGSVIGLLAGGLLCDLFGVRKVIITVSLLAGLTGAARGLSTTFAFLIFTSFALGLISSLLTTATAVTVSSIVSKRQGFAQGLLMAISNVLGVVGILLSASVFSPLLGGWENVLFMYGGLSIIMGILWFFNIKDIDIRIEIKTRLNPGKALLKVLRLKIVWLTGIIGFAYIGCVNGMSGLLPLYLRENGWNPLKADSVLAFYNACGIFGVISLTILSDRIGKRKIILALSLLTACIGVGLLSVIQNPYVWVCVGVMGIFAFAVPAMLNTIFLESKQIPPELVATALSISIAISILGFVISPPVGNSLAIFNLSYPFLFWSALAVVGLIILKFLKETGSRGMKEQE